MTLSSSPVTYTVTYSGTIATGTVTNTTLAKLNISTDLVVVDSSYRNRSNGIHVSANSEISVLLINFRPNTIGDYFAYNHFIQNLTQTKYQYYAVSTGSLAISDQSLSEVLLVGTEDNTAVTVVPAQNIAVPQNIQFYNSPEISVAAGTPFSFTLHKMQTFLFGAPLNDITGTSIVSDKPLTVISGHECGNVPDDVASCQHITEQIPPTVNWGQQFLLTPYKRKPVQYYKIIAANHTTTYKFTSGRYNTTTHYLYTAGSSFTHSTSGSSYCSVSSDKPILVTQLGAGYDLGNTGDPVISIVPSVDQYSQEIVFVSPNINYGDITSHYINIATTTNQSVILVDGVALALTWNAIYDHTNNVIGYGTQLNINSTSLDIPHIISSDTKFSTLVYGFGSFKGYSYSAGVNLTQGIITEVCSHYQYVFCIDYYYCNNTEGCFCRNGYYLLADNVTCKGTKLIYNF